MPTEQQHSFHLRFSRCRHFFTLSQLIRSATVEKIQITFFIAPKKAIRDSEMQCSRKLSLSLTEVTHLPMAHWNPIYFIIFNVCSAQKHASTEPFDFCQPFYHLCIGRKKSLRLHEHEDIDMSVHFDRSTQFVFRIDVQHIFSKRYNILFQRLANGKKSTLDYCHACTLLFGSLCRSCCIEQNFPEKRTSQECIMMRAWLHKTIFRFKYWFGCRAAHWWSPTAAS